MSRRKRKQLREQSKERERAEKVARIQPTTTSLEDSVDSCVAALAQALEHGASSSVSKASNSEIGKSEEEATKSDPASSDPSLVPIPAVGTHGIPTTQKDKILNWNHALHLWLKPSGTYTTALLPPIEVEVARHFKVQALSSFLLESCGGRLKMPAFERWLLDSRALLYAESSSSPDPVLSPGITPNSPSSQRLLEEMVEGGKMERKVAMKVVREFCQRNNVAVRELAEQLAQHQQHSAPFKKGDRIALEKPSEIKAKEDATKPAKRKRKRNTSTTELWTLVFHRKAWNKPFCVKIRPDHYQKLYTLFVRTHKIGPYPLHLSHPRILHIFHLLLLLLLTRYSSLAGGQLLMDLRGGGMQGAIHAQVFAVVQKYFGATTTSTATATANEDTTSQSLPVYEGFGSPMNCHWSAFGSAFPDDLDWHFGSLGNFLQLDFQRGVVEANPPFAAGMMEHMHRHMERCLVKTKEPLTFMVIVPDGGDPSAADRSVVKKQGGKSLQYMLDSPFRRHHILLRAKEHGYIEGAQYMRSTLFKESLYDTSVVVLQSDAAFALQKDEFCQLEVELREAFASRHREEVERRKQEKELSNETS